MRSVRLPGRLAHGLAWAFTLILTLCLTLTCLTWQARRLLTDEQLHESVALDEQVLAAQTARIEEAVNQLAQTYAFQPETVMSLVDEEALVAYNRQVIAWWMGLFQDGAQVDVPQWDTTQVEQAVREDALFQEHTTANLRRSIARDKVAYQVGLAVNRAVLPLRANILAAFMPKIAEYVSLSALAQAVCLLPVLCAVASAIVALVLLLLMHKRMSKAALYMGSGLGASGLCALGLCLLLRLLNISGLVGEISSLLALQLELLGGEILLQVGVYAALALLAGLGLIALHQRDMRRLCRSRGSKRA